MNKKYFFLILQIIIITFIKTTMVHSAEEKSIFCKGIYWSNNTAEYAEWDIIYGLSLIHI